MTDLPPFVGEALGGEPKQPRLFERALTHGSHSPDTYERLEFLGDRVLGVIIADWLFQRFPGEPEGKLSRRYNVLVARETCGEIGRALDLPRYIRLGNQAREDRANMSDNVVGDVVEAMIGAIFLDERLTFSLLVGAALVVAGIYLVNREPRMTADERKAAEPPG